MAYFSTNPLSIWHAAFATLTFSLLGACALHAQGTAPTYQPAAGRTLLRAGAVIDVHTGKETPDATIIVEGDKIVAIAPTATTPAQPGDREVDSPDHTLLPGLIDVHTHLTMATDFDPYFELSMTPGKEAILGVENAKTTLEAGFTTVRNVGASGFTDVALRDEINAGHIPGPHMQVSGPPLGITGGHMDENLLPEQYHVVGEGVADGIAAVQHMVRQNIKYGADLIKIGASGGVLSKGDDPQASPVHPRRDAGHRRRRPPPRPQSRRPRPRRAGHPLGQRSRRRLHRARQLLDDAGIAMMKQARHLPRPHRLPHRLDADQRQPPRLLPAEDARRQRRRKAERHQGHQGRRQSRARHRRRRLSPRPQRPRARRLRQPVRHDAARRHPDRHPQRRRPHGLDRRQSAPSTPASGPTSSPSRATRSPTSASCSTSPSS